MDTHLIQTPLLHGHPIMAAGCSFAHALTSAIQHAHKDYKKQTWCIYSHCFICSVPVPFLYINDTLCCRFYYFVRKIC